MYIIEFMGMPRAGKSTHIDSVESHLKAIGYNAIVSRYGARTLLIDKEPWDEYNKRAIEEVHRGIEMVNPANFDFFIMDRGFYDCATFVNAHYNARRISKDCRDELFGKSIEYAKKFVDDFFFLTLFPELSLAKELRHSRAEGRIMNSEFLPILYNEYLALIQKIIPPRGIIRGEKDEADNWIDIQNHLEFMLNSTKFENSRKGGSIQLHQKI